MKPTTEQYRAVLTRSHRIVAKVDAYYNGVLTAEDVPVVDGTVTADDSGTLKRALSITVPAEHYGTRWDPGNDPLAPLNAYGQRLKVRSGTLLPDGTDQVFKQGTFLITSWGRNEADATVTVNAADLATLIADDKFLQVTAPAAGATYAAAFTALVAGALPVKISATLPAYTVPASVAWDRDRDAALTELCRNWGARWYVDDDGNAAAVPDYPAVTASTPPDLVLSDGADGAITDRARGAERGKLFNIVRVNGALGAAGAAGPTYTASITDPASPIRAGGPYWKVPRLYASDFITTQPQAQTVAQAMLATYSAYGRMEVVGMVPNPAIELGDVARLYTADGDAFTGRVTAYTLPLSATGGAMSLTVSTVPAGGGARRADRR